MNSFLQAVMFGRAQMHVSDQLSAAKICQINTPMSHSFLTLLHARFLRDHNVSLRTKYVPKDVTQILRICAEYNSRATVLFAEVATNAKCTQSSRNMHV